MRDEKLVTLANPNSNASEIYRKIRTNIEYASIDKKLKTINITSTIANEAKSTTASNLAVMFATKFEKVILIDTDLRSPSIHHIFNIKNKIGLVDCILDYANNHYQINQIDLSKYIQIVNDTNIINDIHILTTGSRINNPAEFLGSTTFKTLINDLKNKYDVIILDSPPSGQIVDGMIVSSICDGTLFIIEYNRNSFELTKHCISQLKNAGVNIIGSLLTKVPFNKKNQYQSYSDYYKNKVK